MNARITRTRWVDICALDTIAPGGGEHALVGRLQLAVLRAGDGQHVYAIDDFDPFSKSYAISRGVVVERDGEPQVESVCKQSYSLLSGECIEAPAVRLGVYPARVREGRVELQLAVHTLDSYESLDAVV